MHSNISEHCLLFSLSVRLLQNYIFAKTEQKKGKEKKEVQVSWSVLRSKNLKVMQNEEVRGKGFSLMLVSSGDWPLSVPVEVLPDCSTVLCTCIHSLSSGVNSAQRTSTPK